MDKMGMFGEMLEKGQQTTIKTVRTAVSDVSGSVGNQLGVKSEASPDAKGQAQSQQQQTQVKISRNPNHLVPKRNQVRKQWI